MTNKFAMTFFLSIKYLSVCLNGLVCENILSIILMARFEVYINVLTHSPNQVNSN